MIPRRRPAVALDPAELLSILERHRYLSTMRVGLAGAVLLAALATEPAAPVAVPTATGAFLALALLSAAVIRRGGRAAMPALQGMLLVDGLYLAAVIALTGGTPEALVLLPLIHVVGVTLLCSYRTGLKLALWHTLLFLLVIEASAAGVLGHPMAADTREDAPIAVAGLWVLALGTAFFAAGSERELRGQKYDLTRLAAMVARMDADPEPRDLPGLLLEELCATFRCDRGVILASPTGDLQLLAWVGTEGPADLALGPDEVVARAWSERTTQLRRTIDPESDPRLVSLMPDARNVLVVPLLRDGREGLGAVVLERGSRGGAVRRWEVSMIERFADHAALKLHAAWLTEEREAQLRTIQGLERQLRAHNERLEIVVGERTRELRSTVEQLRETDEQRRRLLEHVVRVAEEERTRIAHDIHDDPVQKMVATKMRLELLRKQHPALPEIDATLDVVRVTIKSLRTLLFDLSPPTLAQEGIASALATLLENAGVPFAWTVDDDGLDEEPPVRSSSILYRIAQEAIANARKHSRADHLTVTLARRDDGTAMQIVDDGVGFEPQEAVVAAPGHLGLASMRERAEMAGGTSSLWSLPGEGTTLEVWLPDLEEGATGVAPREGEDVRVADVVPLPDLARRPRTRGAAEVARTDEGRGG